MTVRAVEGKKPYTGGIAIEVTEDKVINLRLRDENNLIIWDEGDNEIYVDLQLPDGIKPTDAFPVGITTGRVLVADDWDVTGTIICAKTTSGDNIKVLYGDDNKLYVDNGTGLFKEVAFKSDVDTAIQTLRSYVDQQLALKQDKLTAGQNITIDSNNVISATLPAMSRFLSLWDSATGLPISFPGTVPFEYMTGDHYMVENVDATTNYKPDGTEYTGVASTVTETEDVAVGDVYFYDGATWLLQKNHNPEVSFSQIAGQPTDNANLQTALNSKQNVLSAYNGVHIAYNQITADTAIFDLADTSDIQTASDIINYARFGTPIVRYNTDTYYMYSFNVNTTTYDTTVVLKRNWESNGTTDYIQIVDNLGNITITTGTDTMNLGATYTAGNGIDIDQNNEISIDTTVVATKSDLYTKQDALTGGSNGDVLTNVNGTPTWQQPSGGDVMVSTQTGNQFTPGMKIWGGTSSDLGNLTQDLNTLYMAY